MEMFSAKQIASSTSSLTPFFVAELFYFVFNALVAWIMGLIEKLSYYRWEKKRRCIRNGNTSKKFWRI